MIRQNLCVLMHKNPSQTVTYIYDKPNFKERKIFLKDIESEIKKIWISIRWKKLIKMINSNY